MDLPKEQSAVLAAGLGALATFLLQWLWGRFWKKKDSESAGLSALETRVVAIEAKEEVRARLIGSLETNQNRLDGKLDGLQSFWRTEFTKLGEEFRALEGKIDYKLDNLRLELRGDTQKGEERLVTLLVEHQKRVHDRLNVIAADQAKMLKEFVDELVDKKAEEPS